MKTAHYNSKTKGNSNIARQPMSLRSLKCFLLKKLVLTLLMGMLMTQAFSQAVGTLPTKTDYLQKYQHRKAAAWMLLCGGTVMTIVGGATYQIDWHFCLFSDECHLPPPPDNSLSNALIYTGLGAMVGSIPLFISAHHQKRIAASLSIDNQSVKTFYQNTLVSRSQPVLKLKIDF